MDKLPRGYDRGPDGRPVPKMPPNAGNASSLKNPKKKVVKGESGSDKPVKKKPRVTKNGKPKAHGNRISKAQYDAMVVAYMEIQSVSHAADAGGVNEKTASAYIYEGDPSRNLRPIHERFLDAQPKIQERVDKTYVDKQVEWQNMISVTKNMLAKGLHDIGLDPEKRQEFIDKVFESPDKFLKAQSQLMRDEAFAHGSADYTIIVQNEAQIMADQLGIPVERARRKIEEVTQRRLEMEKQNKKG